jgi:hypothetical protein
MRSLDFMWVQKAGEEFGGQRRHLFREKMLSIDRLAFDDISAPSLPQGYRSACLFIPSVERTPGAPEREEWTGDTSSYFTIVIVVLTIDGRSGSIFFADGVNISAITDSLNVGRPCVWGENQPATPSCPRRRRPPRQVLQSKDVQAVARAEQAATTAKMPARTSRRHAPIRYATRPPGSCPATEKCE